MRTEAAPNAFIAQKSGSQAGLRARGTNRPTDAAVEWCRPAALRGELIIRLLNGAWAEGTVRAKIQTTAGSSSCLPIPTLGGPKS
jgi:hypothetical protein